MPQKIDVHGLFIDPEEINGLAMQKRIAIYYPVFHEVHAQNYSEKPKSLWGRLVSQPTQPSSDHLLCFDHMDPYGIILVDAEQPTSANFVVNYKEAVIERFLHSFGKTTKNVAGHIAEMLQIEVSGDRQYRILQSGRRISQTTIREIPAKVRLLSGQWVDVFKSTPGYDFQGGSPYAVTDVNAVAMMIQMKDRTHVLFGAGVDAKDDEVRSTYHALIDVYNKIQESRDKLGEEKKSRPLFQMPQINIQIPKVELPKIEMPQIKFQSPLVFQKTESKNETETPAKADGDNPTQISNNGD